ncbi:MAG: alginate O-acetyltransferase complex protein AlgI [Hyphomicrobiales bacterium]|jgi:D-alanyl-lipoteichoic acid acyltransferase DltB (MBOAT superfamily)|nr:alginate O-acetyltransferase complex protein AlgI [Hyphomicrobiales bacterium]
MLFPSITFLFYFLPLFFILYCAAPGVTAKNVVLLAASLLFYAWGEPRFVLLLAGQIVLNYALALAIGAAEGRRRFHTTAASVATNLLLLGIFKYADFAVGSLNAVAGRETFALPGIALPLGISFFTFHAISYLVDVHRGEVKPNRNLLSVAVYIAMFPQLIAGPIIRYHTIARRLTGRRMTLGRVSAGLRIFIIGLAQKVLIADEVARIAEAAFDKLGSPSMAEAWLGLSAYTIQIYFDFAGYSNMAIGLGLALGFSFPRNFRLPYTARSVTEFWRRWHISLSQWLRDYLYVPLGGSRGSAAETYRNLCLVFVLCGLWHGANWTFVIWGVHHGAFLIVERSGLSAALSRHAWLARVYLLLAVMTGWVWFRARDLEHALSFFGSLVGLHGVSGLSVATHLVLHPATIAALLTGAALAAIQFDLWRALRRLFTRMAQPVYAIGDTAAITVIFALSILSVAAGSYSPFLYFRF